MAELTTPMRILFAADVPPNPNSGAAGTEYQTVEALRALGHDVECIWADDLPHRIRHWNLHYLLELPRAYRDAIQARSARRSYDAIHVNQPYAWLAARAHRLSGRPGVFVNRSHGWEPLVTAALKPWRRVYGVPEWRFPRGLVGRPMRWLLEGLYPRLAARWSDGIVVSSSTDRDWISQHYHLPPSRVAAIPQAPSPAFLSAPALPMSVARQRRVLHVGQLAFFKAPHIVAEVFRRLAERCPDLVLTWCCAGGDHEEARSLLTPEAARRVCFVGWMSQEELARLYDSHGIFLFPSFYEGFGKVFLEAMARGLCVVASDVGGARDVIRSGADGQTAPPGDVGALVDAVLALQGNLPLAQSISTNAREVASRYTWERTARGMLSFYTRLSARLPASQVV